MPLSSATTTADGLLAVVVGLRRVWRRRLRAQLPGEPLRGAEVELLHLVEAEPGIGVAAAAKALRLAGNSVSTLVNQLVDAGYLRREPDPTDRRACRLVVTPAATERLARWRSARSELVGTALARLTTRERQSVQDALPALHRLLEELEHAEPGSTAPGSPRSGSTTSGGPRPRGTEAGGSRLGGTRLGGTRLGGTERPEEER